MSSRAGDLRLKSRVDAGPDIYRFHTAEGVLSPDSFRTAELALAEACWERVRGRLLCPAANFGVVGTLLGRSADSVSMTESSARAARCCRQNAATNDVDATVALTCDLSSLDGHFQTAAYAPKPYTPLAIATQFIVDALAVLESGGELFLAASKRNGLNRYETVLKRYCDSVERVDRTDDVRVLRGVRTTDLSTDRHVTPSLLTPTVEGVDLEITTLPGTFAASELDHGTRLLIETVDWNRQSDGRILDLCCGCGPIGAYAGAVTDSEVWLTDDSRIATWCAERTLTRTGVDGSVVTPDCLRGVEDTRFDTIVCNPPTHAGNGILAALFDGAADVLEPDGTFWFVHHQHLDLTPHARRFDRVERVGTGSEHVVYRATR